MKRLNTALLALLLAASPAAADTLYQCSDGTQMRYLDETREMVISGVVDGFGISLPFAGSASRFSTWSSNTGPEGVGCDDDTAPCAEYWQPARGPAQVFYQLEPGDEQVDCAEAK